jgi:tetratricopeptide (TPR) repeat protein
MRNFVSRTVCILIVSLPLLPLVAQNAPDVKQKVGALEQQVQKYLQEQKPQLAIPVLREIISLDPKNLNAQANLGVLLFFEGKYTEAIPPMRTALQLQHDLWRIEALLGIAEKRTGDPAEALNDLERAFSHLDVKLEELEPQSPQIVFVNYQISRQIMDQSLLSMMMVAPDSAEMHMILADELKREGDHTNAIAQYREAIRLNPMLPGAHFELAEQLRTSPDPALNAQAEAEYKAAIQVNQYDELSWRQLGGIAAAKGDFKTAEEDYKKALALQPGDSDAKTGLAIVLVSLHQTKEAISLLESAVKDDPTNVTAHYRLSMLYRRAGRTADAEREMETFRHYKEVKDKLSKIYKQLAGPAIPE